MSINKDFHSGETSLTHIEPTTKKITKEELNSRLVFCFWPELYPFMSQIKYAPQGSTSLEIPTFHTDNIKKVIKEATVEDYQYNLMEGRIDLRESVLDNFPEVQRFLKAGINLNAENVLISSGAVSGINSTIGRLCENSDDEVLIFEPMYPFHMGKVVLKNLTLKTVRQQYDPQTRKFRIDFEALKKALSPKTKIIIICNPNNPTCKVFTKEEYQQISEIIKDFPNLVVIEDAVYFLYHNDAHQPIPYAVVNPQDFQRTITFYSGGKMYNITGTRLGIALGPEELLAKVAEIYPLEVQCVPVFEQMVIRENLKSANEKNQHGRDFYEETRKDIVRRGKLIEEEVGKLGIKTAIIEGSYYAIFDVEALREEIDRKYYKRLDKPEESTPELDKAFCRMLFLEKKIGLIPLSHLYFGGDVPDNLVRVAINRNDDDLKYLLDSLKRLLAE